MPLDQPVYEPESDDLDLPATKRDLQGFATKEELHKALAANARAITDAVSAMLEDQRRAVRSDIAEFKDGIVGKLSELGTEQAAGLAAHERMTAQLADHEEHLVRSGKPAYQP